MLAPRVVALVAPLALGLVGDLPRPDDATSDATMSVYGNDRVGDILLSPGKLPPANLAAFERLFGVGRACVREDMKEIFVVEAPSTRRTGKQEATASLPRLVIGGCNVGGALRRRSFELLTAIVSDPTSERARHGDPLDTDFVEVMALDRNTDRYNFYVFRPTAGGGAGTVERLFLEPDGRARQITYAPGSPVRNEVLAGPRCFGCHANGEVVVNNLEAPWRDWISAHKPRATGSYAGETRSLVEAAGAASNATGAGRSLAYELEKIVLASYFATVSPSHPHRGYVGAVVDGRLSGGVERLFRSVFCDTNVNLASVASDLPPGLSIDSSLWYGVPPKLELAPGTPEIADVPVRGHFDKAVEHGLVQRGYLTRELAIAIRLLDPGVEALSEGRCRVHDEVDWSGDPSPAAVQGRVRDAVARAFARRPLADGAARDLASAALAPDATPQTIEVARARYLAEQRATVERDVASIADPAHAAHLRERTRARQRRARALFAGNVTPLPFFD